MARRSWLIVVGPGILVAATGVGAGDLLTAGLGGSAVGLTLLWAAVAGAGLKWFLNEGIARWQMATGTTLLEGWAAHLGKWIQWVFLVYLLGWSVVTGGALINACGAGAAAMLPIGNDPRTGKIVWGFVHSLVAWGLVSFGGFKFFARFMAACIAVMFVSVVATAVMLRPDWSSVARGIFTPSIPPGALVWTLGVIGGVGGTVTLLSYGYWIREAGREGISGVRQCRIDLALGYAMTAIFGVAMVIIGSRTKIERGENVALQLSAHLRTALGPAGGWIFLAGFWGAVFSSLLGVWQSVPYLFSDFMSIRRGDPPDVRAGIDHAKTPAYRIYLAALAIVPLPLLWMELQTAQLAYAILGSLFMPLLALTLLIMNNRVAWVGRSFRNGILANAALIVTLVFFAYAGLTKAIRSAQAFLDG